MATRFYLLFPDVDDGTGDELYQRIKDEVNRIESKLSRFIPESDISKLNKKAFQKPVETDEECFEILKACKYGWELTNGTFDITLRPLMDYWKENDGEAESAEKLDEIRNKIGMEHVELDEESKTVRFTSNFVELDLGGFGKGYALEKVKQLVESSSVNDAFISFGESSILAMGNHPAGGSWRVGINDYMNPGSSIHEFEVDNASVSTSSSFYLDDEGELHIHDHVIEPQTGRMHNHCTAASVLAESPVLAEILSTACLLMPEEKIREMLEKYEEITVIKIDYEQEEPEVDQFS